MLDWDATKPVKVAANLINTQQGFHDFELPNRPGYSRISFDAKANAAKLLKYFKDLVEDQHVV